MNSTSKIFTEPVPDDSSEDSRKTESNQQKGNAMNRIRHELPDDTDNPEIHIQRTLETFFTPGDVFEIRVLKTGWNQRQTYTGYFNDPQKAIHALTTTFDITNRKEPCHDA